MIVRKIILAICILMKVTISTGQTEKKDIIFIGFNESTADHYFKEVENGEKVKVRSFLKNDQTDGGVHFYIEGLLFVHLPSVMEAESLKTSFKPECEILKPEEIASYIVKIKKTYPLGYKFPSEKFPRLVIVDSSSGVPEFYEVIWRPYNE